MVSEKPWGSIKDSDYRDASAYCNACLIDLNTPGAEKIKEKCKLPVYEPGGALNRNACHAAAAALAGARGGVQAAPDIKKRAARKLKSLYTNQLKEEPPDSLTNLAR